jgi:hypothetical protein
VYTVRGREGTFTVFVLAKVDDGLISGKAMGVATKGKFAVFLLKWMVSLVSKQWVLQYRQSRIH